MGRKVKLTKQRCNQCKYATNMTGATVMNKAGGFGTGVVACGYILKTGQSRVFKTGRHKKGYDPGYCDCYEPGKRVESLDSMTKHKTLKKGKKKNEE